MNPNEVNELNALERAEEIDTRAWINAFSRAYAKLSPQKRADSMIRAFFKIENPTRDEYKRFIGWLMNGDNTEAKEEALGRVFEEMCEYNAN